MLATNGEAVRGRGELPPGLGGGEVERAPSELGPGRAASGVKADLSHRVGEGSGVEGRVGEEAPPGLRAREEVRLLVQEDAERRIVACGSVGIDRIGKGDPELLQARSGVFTEDPRTRVSAESHRPAIDVYGPNARGEPSAAHRTLVVHR